MNPLGINRIACVFLTIFAATTLAANPALAHSFNVTLVIPLSGDAAVRGRQFRQGFMLATAERDSHPDQESDGHLGGLDVYVHVIDARGDIRAEFRHRRADIVVTHGSRETLSLIKTILDATKAVLLPPSQRPFAKSSPPADFVAAYKNKFGAAPSPPPAASVYDSLPP